MFPRLRLCSDDLILDLSFGLRYPFQLRCIGVPTNFAVGSLAEVAKEVLTAGEDLLAFKSDFPAFPAEFDQGEFLSSGSSLY